MKRFLSILTTLFFILTCSVTGCAADTADTSGETLTITMQIDNPVMTVNGVEQNIDDNETAPVIVNNRTLVPIRAIIEAMGGEVNWNEVTQTVTLDYGDDEIILVIDSTTAYLNGEAIELDIAPTIINERTMLPIRFIAEGFSFNVDWVQETQTVTISKAAEKTQISTITTEATEESDATIEPTQGSVPVDENKQTESKTLVAYFSNTGNTKGIAEYIAEITGADLFEIVPEDPYTDEDLNYNDSSSRSTLEMNDPTSRPAIASVVENIEQYDTIYIGYPIWWGAAPRIISTFLESYDFSGKNIVPFCTSASSGIGSSASNLHSLASEARWFDGRRFAGSASESSVADWIETLEFEN